MPYRLKFINRRRFMTSLLSNIVTNLAERIHKIRFKYRHIWCKKYETCRIRYKDCEYCIEYTRVLDDLRKCKSLRCNKNYKKKFNENLKKRLEIF